MGTYFSAVIGRRLIGLNYYQERFQADFRFGLVHVRNNLEPIFIYDGERHETDQLRRPIREGGEQFQAANLVEAQSRFLYRVVRGPGASGSILVPGRGLCRRPA